MPSSIELTQELIRFNTINPPGAERPCAERLAYLLESAGFAVELVPFGEGRAQILARLGGTSDKLPLGFTGHIDTVPLGAQPWSVDPFAADIADGKLYGRGSSDPERKSRNTRENHRTRPLRPKRFYTTKTPCGSSHGAVSLPLLPRMTLGFS